MKRLLVIFSLLFVAAAQARSAAAGEYIFLIGGPSLQQWEKYKPQPHDHWWANFVHAARVRTEQIRAKTPDAMITWLVYGQGYKDRAQQEHQDLISHIESVRDKYKLNLIYFQNGDEVINYLNNGQSRNRLKVASFEYFGHSNWKCFMFDYSSNIESGCKSWLHENELTKISGKNFARGAYIKSWGCHTGESMSEKWRAATGTRMIGAIGKTDFSTGELPALSSTGGKWVN